MNIHKHLLSLVGNTPLVELNFGTKPKILAKLEYLNPGGSIKDRAALFMIEKALYELCYELANRPDWVTVPLTGLLGVLDRPAGV